MLFVHLDFARLEVVGREVTVAALLVPLVRPSGGAQSLVGAVELLAGSELLSLGVHATEVVDVVLEAAVGLVLVGEAGVVTESVELRAEILVVRHL